MASVMAQRAAEGIQIVGVHDLDLPGGVEEFWDEAQAAVVVDLLDEQS
jgi:hypothetical protein